MPLKHIRRSLEQIQQTREHLDGSEVSLIRAAFKITGTVRGTARELGITRSTVTRALDKKK